MAIILENLGMVCALGKTHDEIIRHAMTGATDQMHPHTVKIHGENVPFGAVKIETKFKMRFQDLIITAYSQISETMANLRQDIPSKRIGIVIGTCNTGIHEAQRQVNEHLATGIMPAEFELSELELGTPAEFLRELIGATGPAYTISTACSSSTKVFQSAKELLEQGICDIVIAGGVDARCDFVVNGFDALSSVSRKLTNPMSKNRDGINLGEGAALFIMRRGDKGIKMMGVGETSDAYHLTHPDPDGIGAHDAMMNAITNAGLNANDIGFVLMHGTGTVANDAMESRAIFDIFSDHVPCASAKPMTGHTLGAAGAINAGLAWLMLKHDFIIPHVFDGEFDPGCAKINLATADTHKNIRYILSNSFAFGGSNACMILGK